LHQVGDLFELNVKLRCQKVTEASNVWNKCGDECKAQLVSNAASRTGHVFRGNEARRYDAYISDLLWVYMLLNN